MTKKNTQKTKEKAPIILSAEYAQAAYDNLIKHRKRQASLKRQLEEESEKVYAFERYLSEFRENTKQHANNLR